MFTGQGTEDSDKALAQVGEIPTVPLASSGVPEPASAGAAVRAK